MKVNEKNGTYEYVRFMRDGSTEVRVAVIRSKRKGRKTVKRSKDED